MIQGDLKDQYDLLWQYVNELKRLNPRRTVELQAEHGTLTAGKPVFKRLYVCLRGLKERFKHCRPIIGVDRAHLKKY